MRTLLPFVVPRIDQNSCGTHQPGAAGHDDTAGQAESSESAVIESVEDYTAGAEQQVAQLAVELAPREGVGPIRVPRLRMTAVESRFSLADITDHSEFRKLGEQLAADPTRSLGGRS